MKDEILNSKLDALLEKIDPDKQLESRDALLKLAEAIDELPQSEPKEELWGKVVRAATIELKGKKRQRYWERAVQQATPILAKRASS
jgi:3-polyprenyl-4-hydroxybenzoate decarboxylase